MMQLPVRKNLCITKSKYRETINANQNNPLVCISWHPLLNQIIVGGGSGEAWIYYDEKISKKGALICEGREVKFKD